VQTHFKFNSFSGRLVFKTKQPTPNKTHPVLKKTAVLLLELPLSL